MKSSSGKQAAYPIETIENPTLREKVHRAVLPGGLQVYVCPKRGFKKRFACYSTRYGSIDSVFTAPGEEGPGEVPDGIAHFLEHTLFETPRGNASELFARNGAFSNATTSFIITSYLFSASQRFYENLALLLEFVEGPYFNPEKIEKERGIIEQEIRMCHDDPGWVCFMGLLESLFVKHPLRLDIAGSPESIGKIDADALDRCYRTFYSPSNMILFVIGDLDQEEVFDFVARHSKGGSPREAGIPAQAQTPGGSEIQRIYPEEPPEVFRGEFQKEMAVALPKLLMGFKEIGIPQEGRPFLEKELVSELALDMLFGRGGDSFQRLYEAQLILDDFGSSFHACRGVGYSAVGGETPRPNELREAILKEILRVQESGIPPQDFERQKRKFIGSFIRHFNSLEYIAGNYTYFRFQGVDLFEAIDTLEAVRREQVEERIREFRPQRSAVSLILPKR